MSQQDQPNFETNPVLNSPYDPPEKHWELNKETRKPTNRIIDGRRAEEYFIPVPQTRRESGANDQLDFKADETKPSNTQVKSVRAAVERWRRQTHTLPPNKWDVTPATARLITHWRAEAEVTPRLFFCQLEAAV